MGPKSPWHTSLPDGQVYSHLAWQLAAFFPSATARLWSTMGGVTSRYAATDKGKRYYDRLTTRAAEKADGKQIIHSASEQTQPEAAAIVRGRLLRVCLSWDTQEIVRDAYLLLNP